MERFDLPVDLFDLSTNPILTLANAESTMQSSPLNLACLVVLFFRNLYNTGGIMVIAIEPRNYSRHKVAISSDLRAGTILRGAYPSFFPFQLDLRRGIIGLYVWPYLPRHEHDKWEAVCRTDDLSS